MLILAIAGIAITSAQVRISGKAAPNSSAVLDLNPDDKISEGNATLGLALPRVKLKGSANASPLQSHVKGIIVYNVATTGDVVPGLYQNDGTKWLRQPDAVFMDESLKSLARLLAEKDSIVGNEVLNATSGGGLIRAGAGTNASPYTLGIAPGGVTNDKIADGAITINKLSNKTIIHLGDSIASNIYSTILGDTIINYITQNIDNSVLMDSVVNAISNNNSYIKQLIDNIAVNEYNTVLGDSIINYITKNIGLTNLGDSISYYITNNFSTQLGDTVMQHITNGLDGSALMDSISYHVSNNNAYLKELINNIARNVYNTTLGDTLVNHIAHNITNTVLGDSILQYITNDIRNTILGDSIISLVHENERDGVIGNEVTNATTNGGLTRSGSGTAASPYTLGIADSGITSSRLADKSVTVGKVNATGTASATTFLRGDGSWSAPVGDGQGVTSVNGANGITVTNGTTTPTVSLPAGTTTGNVLKWNGTAWASSTDAGITSESDGVIGNEVTNATANGGLTRSGSGTAAAPYTLGITDGAITTARLADNAVTTAKITDKSVTIGKVNATGTASATTYLRGDGSWSAPAGDGQGVTSVSGSNGITVTNGTTTPTVSLPAGTTTGNVLKWNGTAWASSADAGITSESDGIIGNEVINATTNGGLTRAGSGTTTSPYTLGITDGAITTARLADNAVTTAKITDKSVTIGKVNATGTASATTYLRGDGTWSAPAGDGQGVTSVSGANGITVTNGTTTPTVSLPAGTTTGNVLKWDGTAWASSADAGLTSESDGIIGNEVTNATTNGGLTRSGSGTAAAPYTLGITDGAITTARLADNAVTTAKITDKSVTIGKVNATGTASATTYLRGDGSWSAPVGDGQGVTSVSGSNGITVTNGTTTPTVSLPAGTTSGNVLKWNGTAWASSADAGITSESDGVIGNEVTNATTSGGLTRAGSGTAAAPYTLGISDGAITTARLADNAVTTAKITDKSVTIGKVNATGTASSTTFLRGDGAWSAPAGDGQGVTSVSGANGITVTNGTTTPTVSLPTGTTTGNVLKWNGTAWASSADAGLTSESDGIIGNEVTNATTSGGLVRAGSGTATSPYTLGISDGAITTARLADNAVTTAKITDKSVTIGKVNATGTASSTTFLRGDGAWSAPAGDGQGVTSVSGANGITVTNGTTTPTVSLPTGTTTGNVLKWNGTAWASAADAGITSESDGIVGNEVTNATTSGGLTRAGSGTAAAPYTLGISDGAITTVRIADNAVTSAKISDGTIADADISATANITGTKLADKSVAVAKVNATGTASATTYLRGDGTWSAGDGQGVTSVTGANGITVTNGTTTPTISLPAGTASGNVLKWNGTTWASSAETGITTEADGIIGNEVVNATTDGGLVRAGAGTATDPYTLGIADNAITSARIANGTIKAEDLNGMGASNRQVLAYNGSAWAPSTNYASPTTITSGSTATGSITSGGYSDIYTWSDLVPGLYNLRVRTNGNGTARFKLASDVAFGTSVLFEINGDSADHTAEIMFNFVYTGTLRLKADCTGNCPTRLFNLYLARF
ncbi:hypothetical protein JCM30204_11640 [Dysgonomonas termitidis]